MITPNDIREKEFALVDNQGYNPDEVDDFLDAIAGQMEELVRENLALSQQVREAAEKSAAMEELVRENHALSQQVKEAAEKSAAEDPTAGDEHYFRNLEATLRETLISAQRIAEDTVAKAKAEAQEKISGAEEQAAAILSTAREEADTAKAEADTVRKGIEDYRARFRQLVEEQATILKGASFFED